MQSVLSRLVAGSLLVILVDQASKSFFSSYNSILLVPSLLSLSVTRNEGIAFSIPLSGWPLLVLTMAVLVGFCFFFFRHLDSRSGVAQAAFVLIVGGGVGNLIDRVLWGSVTDFIAISAFPVFNLADAAVAIGAGLLLWRYHTIRYIPKNANPTIP